MVSRTSFFAALIALLLGAPAASAAEPARPVNLTAAVARTAAQAGWRNEALADGRLTTIGVNVINDVTHVIGIACGAGHRPEVAVDARGVVAMPRAILLETETQLTAIPIAPAGASAQGTDTLLSALALTPDGALKLSFDDQAFPLTGVRAALEPVWKECEQLFGWRITEPDPQQFAWSYVAGNEPRLVYKGPATDAFAAALTCDPDRGSVTVSVADLAKGARRAQPARFTVEAGGESFAVIGQTDPGGLSAGTLTDPAVLLSAVLDSTRLGFRTKSTQVTVATQGLRLLLPRFRHACALP